MKSILLPAAFAAVLFGMAFSSARADTCTLTLTTPKSVLPEDEKQTICVKVGIKGFELKSDKQRKPLNVALVLDRSGSMSGDKIKNARLAACEAVELLRDDDIVSVVAYDSDVEVIVPATKKGDGKEILSKINSLNAGGTTALYEGTKHGADEVKKFLDSEHINRVILLSDGQANVGPSSVEELGELGKKLGGEGICVTTFGLGEGYNEDLMIALAQKSDGNHVFITKASNMTEVFSEEFQDAAEVVAQEVSCKLKCEEGIRPVRILNSEGNIDGGTVSFSLNQIYSGRERYVMVEVEVPAGSDGQSRKVAACSVTYANMSTNTTEELTAELSVRFSASDDQIKASVDKQVSEEYASQVAILTNMEATALRDAGKVSEARKMLKSNSFFLRSMSDSLGGSAALEADAAMNDSQEEALGDDSSWNSNRKKMRANQAAPMKQQRSGPVK
ncbi:MAG: VWA domain-containing protein [Thermoguttaceae bacterium]|nr:VWA domain-containing protein [Thermoguttaceae bacterium]